MKPFDYNNYVKNNPLLKEDLESDIRQDLEKVSEIKNLKPNEDSSGLAEKVSNLYEKMLKVARATSFDIDDDAVDDTMEEIVKKVGHTDKQKKKKGYYKFAFGAHPEFETLNDKQLQAIIPFLEAVIKERYFGKFDEWDGTKIKSDDEDEYEDSDV